jgi:hypothetical protein
MNTIGVAPDDGATAPLAQKVMVTILANRNVTTSEVAGIGVKAPVGFEYVAVAVSVNANTCSNALALVAGINPPLSHKYFYQ